MEQPAIDSVAESDGCRPIARAIGWLLLPSLVFAWYRLNTHATVGPDAINYAVGWHPTRFHPHHLLWSWILYVGGAICSRIPPGFDPIQSTQLANQFLSCWAPVALGMVLRRLAGLTYVQALACAALFGVSGLLTAMSSESEAYNTAIALYLASLALLPPFSSSHPVVERLRLPASCLLFSLSVLMHQKMCLAVIPLCYLLWRGCPRAGLRRTAIFAVASGAICFAAYFSAWYANADVLRKPFLLWMVKYGVELGGDFGELRRFVEPEAYRQIASNWGSAFVFHIAYRHPFPFWISALLFGATVVSAVLAWFRPGHLARALSIWFLLFEVILLWWEPTLRQMQTLSFPAGFMLLVWSVKEAASLPAFAGNRLSRHVVTAAAFVSIPLVMWGNRDLGNRPFRMHSMAEARALFYNEKIDASDPDLLIMVYDNGLGKTYPLACGRYARDRVLVVDEILPLIQEARGRLAAHFERPGARVFVHKTVMLLDGDRFWEPLARGLDPDSASARVVIGDSKEVVGFWWTKQPMAEAGTGSTLPEAVIQVFANNNSWYTLHPSTWRYVREALDRASAERASSPSPPLATWRVAGEHDIELGTSPPGMFTGKTTGYDPFLILEPADAQINLSLTPYLGGRVEFAPPSQAGALDVHWPNGTGVYWGRQGTPVSPGADGRFAADLSRTCEWVLPANPLRQFRIDLGNAPGVQFALSEVTLSSAPATAS